LLLLLNEVYKQDRVATKNFNSKENI